MSELLKYNKDSGSLAGKLLVAMPYLEDPRFQHSVIYICGHDETGAMGIILNKRLHSVTFKDLLEQLRIDYDKNLVDCPLNYGGPAEVGRGFVLHTTDYLTKTSVTIDDTFALSVTVEILRAISRGEGPKKAIVTLGYVSWSGSQLETEIQNNGWLVIDASEALIFEKDAGHIWHKAMASIGINSSYIATEMGHA